MPLPPRPLEEPEISPKIPVDWSNFDDIKNALIGKDGIGEVDTRQLLGEVQNSLVLNEGDGSVALGKTLEKLGIVRHIIVTDRDPRHVPTLRQSGVRYILARHPRGSIKFYDIDISAYAFNDHIYRESFGGPYVLLYNKEEAWNEKLISKIRRLLSPIIDSE